MNEKLAKIRIKAKCHNISLICAHAPTEEKDDEVKYVFYANLKGLYNKCPAHDIKIVLRDFNAKVGQEGIFGPTVGQFSLYSTTSPNEVGSTMFQYLDIHKATCLSGNLHFAISAEGVGCEKELLELAA